MNYGHFNEKGNKFVVTSPDAPRPFDVMLFNDVCYANVHHTGIGCFVFLIIFCSKNQVMVILQFRL